MLKIWLFFVCILVQVNTSSPHPDSLTLSESVYDLLPKELQLPSVVQQHNPTMSQKSGGEAGPPPPAALASGRTRFTSLLPSLSYFSHFLFMLERPLRIGFAQSCVHVMFGWRPVKLNFFCVFLDLYFTFLFSGVLIYFCLSIWVCALFFLVLLTCASRFTWYHTF